MHHSARRPHEDSNEIALLRAHPVNEFASEEIGYSIENREESRDGSIVIVGPMKLRSDEIFPCQRQNLTVHVVDCRSHEEQCTDNPTKVRHL